VWTARLEHLGGVSCVQPQSAYGMFGVFLIVNQI
jgi:hypothetical protein